MTTTRRIRLMLRLHLWLDDAQQDAMDVSIFLLGERVGERVGDRLCHLIDIPFHAVDSWLVARFGNAQEH